MQKTNILRGTWSAKGNFTGKNISGERIFISKSLMSDLGYKPGDDAKGFAVAYKTEMIGQLDANNEALVDSEGVAIKVPRVEATAVFRTIDELTDAFASEGQIDIDIKRKVMSSAKSAGLTEKAVESLLSVAI